MTDLMDEAPAAAAVVVARVPVVDTAREIVGFELVNRSTIDPAAHQPATHDLASHPQPDAPQTVVTVSSLLGSVDVNVSAVVGDKRLFCTVDRAVLVSDARLKLPPRRTVLQVPTRGVDDELLAAVQSYKQSGFTIMVEHQAWDDATRRLLAMADLVKIDLASGTPAEIIHAVDGYQAGNVQLVAASCDTEDQLAWAQAAGFDLFIGRAARAPESAGDAVGESGGDAGDELPCAPLPLSQVQLGVELLSRDLDLDRIEDVLRGDPALVIQLLNMASAGAGGGLRRQVRSLREALVVMGTARIREWAALVILSRHSQKQSDALVTTLVRARMCELLARSRGVDGPFAFTAGILSALHILLGVPVSEVEQQIKVDEDLTNAAFRREGPVGALITRAEQHEQSLGTGGQHTADHDQVTLIAAMAFGWAASYAQAMDSAARG